MILKTNSEKGRESSSMDALPLRHIYIFITITHT